MELPIYYFEIDEFAPKDKGTQNVALVDNPAVLLDWMAFAEDKDDKLKQMNFSIQNEEQRIITGVAFMPNFPIKRVLNKMEFYVAANENTVAKMCRKFMRENRNLSIKLTHEAGVFSKGVYLFESFITDTNRGISAPKGFDVPNGTWFISCKVDNDEIWSKIKAKEINGFSLELFPTDFSDAITLEDSDIQKIIESIV